MSYTARYSEAVLSNEPFMDITQAGRFTYDVTLHHGMSSFRPGWRVLGRRRAERKAARELARYKRKQAWRSDTWLVS